MVKVDFEVFRPDKQLTESDVDEIIRNYDPKKHEAPVVLGHPKTDSPAYGWIKTIYWRTIDGIKRLWASTELLPEMVELIKKGLYKKRSIAAAKLKGVGWTLRHVGFLGAAAPAIEGMPDISALKMASDFVEFSEVEGEYMIEAAEKKEKAPGAHEEDTLPFTQEQVDEIKKAAVTEAIKATELKFSENIKGFEAKITELKKSVSDKDAEIEKLKKSAEDTAKEFAKKEVDSFVNAMEVPDDRKNQIKVVMYSAIGNDELMKNLKVVFGMEKAPVNTGEMVQFSNEPSPKSEHKKKVDAIFSLSDEDYKKYDGSVII